LHAIIAAVIAGVIAVVMSAVNWALLLAANDVAILFIEK